MTYRQRVSFLPLLSKPKFSNPTLSSWTVDFLVGRPVFPIPGDPDGGSEDDGLEGCSSDDIDVGADSAAKSDLIGLSLPWSSVGFVRGNDDECMGGASGVASSAIGFGEGPPIFTYGLYQDSIDP